jgi:hypothetical protein
MQVRRTGSAAFEATFETEEELREEHRVNLSFGALRLPTPERAAPDALLLVQLQGPFGGGTAVKAKVVAALPDGLALAIDGDPASLLETLLARPAQPPDDATTPEDSDGDTPAAPRQNAWDRVRGLPQMEKILLAVKADRTERALLLQDNDPRVLLSLLRNPRLTIDEVARLAKSAFLTYQIADVIMQATHWMTSIDVRLGLIHNPKTPQAFALRILPSLPEPEIRAIARAGTSMALKQAALRRLQR